MHIKNIDFLTLLKICITNIYLFQNKYRVYTFITNNFNIDTASSILINFVVGNSIR